MALIRLRKLGVSRIVESTNASVVQTLVNEGFKIVVDKNTGKAQVVNIEPNIAATVTGNDEIDSLLDFTSVTPVKSAGKSSGRR